MPNYNFDDYTRGAWKRGGVDVDKQGESFKGAVSATGGRISRIWDRVKSELNTLTGTPGGRHNPATFGLQMMQNAPDYYQQAVRAGDWLGNVQKKGLGYLGRGSEKWGDFIGDQDFSKYGKMLGDWGLGERPNVPPGTPDASRPMAPPMSEGMNPIDKPSRPARPLPGMEGPPSDTVQKSSTPPVRSERTTGGTLRFAPNPSAQPDPAGNKGNQRYLDIARASETDIDKRFEKMGGIEAIRGTDKTFWSPVSKEEYLTRREAVAGRTGLLGPKDAATTEKEQLDRGVEMSKAGMQAQTSRDVANIGARASTDAANIRGKAGIEASKIASQKGRFKYQPPEVNFDDEIIQEGIVFDEQTGRNYPMSQMTPEMTYKVLANKLSQKDTKSGLDFFRDLGEIGQEHIIPLLSKKERELILKSQNR